MYSQHVLFQFVESLASRPRLKLLPRTKPVEDASVAAVSDKMRNSSIFGYGKPREAQPDDYVEPEGRSKSRTTSESEGH